MKRRAKLLDVSPPAGTVRRSKSARARWRVCLLAGVPASTCAPCRMVARRERPRARSTRVGHVQPSSITGGAGLAAVAGSEKADATGPLTSAYRHFYSDLKSLHRDRAHGVALLSTARRTSSVCRPRPRPEPVSSRRWPSTTRAATAGPAPPQLCTSTRAILQAPLSARLHLQIPHLARYCILQPSGPKRKKGAIRQETAANGPRSTHVQHHSCSPGGKSAPEPTNKGNLPEPAGTRA